MLLWLLVALLPSSDGAARPPLTGKIQGVVVNGSLDDEPTGGVNVLLRGGFDGALEPLARTQTDLYGKFTFEDLPLDPSIDYLPGADRDGMHYPGQRVRLDGENRFPSVTIRVFDAIESPTPLLVEQHEIDVRVQQELIEINETLIVSNPSEVTYVGEQGKETLPATLRLSIPPGFDRITFSSEFYGRRFRILDHQPVTDIPWPPGQRALIFSYCLPISKTGGIFCRTLDLPSRNIRLRVRGNRFEDVSCNLDLANGNDNDVVFTSGTKELGAGYRIEMQMGRLPFPWVEFTRWSSVVGLTGLILVTAVLLRRSKK